MPCSRVFAKRGLRESDICEGPGGEAFFLGKDARVGILSLVVFQGKPPPQPLRCIDMFANFIMISCNE